MAACVHDLFERQAARTPHAFALSFASRHLDYGSLSRLSNQLAHHLCERGLPAEGIIAVCLERSADAVVVLLAVLKAGGAYLVLDPEDPPARTALILAEARPTLIITTALLKVKLPRSETPLLLIDEQHTLIASMPVTRPHCDVRPEQLAYLTYTSGSTGQPKGVLVPHRAVSRLVANPNYVTPGIDEAVLHASPLSFDATTFEIWWPLCQGARVAVFPAGPLDLEKLSRFLVEQKITTAFFTTTLFHELVWGPIDSLSGIRQLLTGGEAMSVTDINRATRYLSETRLANIYGPTENTTFSSFRPIARDETLGNSVPIGRAVTGTHIRILDDQLRPLASGAMGEIFLGGEGLAHGYLDRPELTASSFVFVDGERLYRTGDLGSLRDDGDVEFHGRRDHQIKLRGFRIELGEIEAQLRRHLAVDEAVVVSRPVATDTKGLAAYVTLREPVTASALRDHLAAHLPAYMLPSIFVQLAELPRLSNGKVDRDALPEPIADNRLSADSPIGATPSRLEQLVAESWAALLDVPHLRPTDDFFESGGNSLLALRLIARTTELFGATLAIYDLFSNPTVTGFTRVLREALNQRQLAGPTNQLTAASRRPIDQIVSLQEAGFLSRPDTAAMQGVRIAGPLNLDLLERCVRTIVTRHEVLRSTFTETAGGWRRRISSTWSGFRLVDLKSLGKEAQQQAVELQSTEDGSGFDLSAGPLFRVTVLALEAELHLLLLSAQHSIFDGYSRSVFWNELRTLYTELKNGYPIELPPLPLQYADYAIWQRQYIATTESDDRRAYWKKELAEARSPTLPFDADDGASVGSPGRAVFKARLDAALLDDARQVAKREQSSVFTVFLAAFTTLLREQGQTTDFAVSTFYANRHTPGVETLIGCFNQQVMMRFRSSSAGDQKARLDEARQTVLRAYADVDIAPYLASSVPTRVGFNFNPVICLDLPALSVTRFDRLRSSDKKPWLHLSLRLEEEETTMWVAFLYDRELFSENTVRTLAERYEQILREMVTE